MISLGNPIYVDLDISIRYVVCCSINNSDLAWHWVNSAFVLYLEGSHVKSLELQRRVSVLCSYLCCKFVCLFSFFISFYRKNVPSLEDHMFQVNRITETCTSVICSYLCCKFHSVFLDKISFFLSFFHYFFGKNCSIFKYQGYIWPLLTLTSFFYKNTKFNIVIVCGLFSERESVHDF